MQLIEDHTINTFAQDIAESSNDNSDGDNSNGFDMFRNEMERLS